MSDLAAIFKCDATCAILDVINSGLMTTRAGLSLIKNPARYVCVSMSMKGCLEIRRALRHEKRTKVRFTVGSA